MMIYYSTVRGDCQDGLGIFGAMTNRFISIFRFGFAVLTEKIRIGQGDPHPSRLSGVPPSPRGRQGLYVFFIHSKT
ncbi:MAG: hypothetical protein IJX72_03175, partial [Clostridia bacterium]|nr:hypothetical protein [Clostridia bacterium]